MSPVLAKLTRWMPAFFAIAALLAVIQLAVLAVTFFGRVARDPWLAAHAVLLTGTLGTLAGVGLVLIVLSAARAAGRLPLWLTRWSWLMDILDRLTNRKEARRAGSGNARISRYHA